jgi:hypothetical protein
MGKAYGTCNFKGCFRAASHQPTLRIWPAGIPTEIPRFLDFKLRAGPGVCKRCGETLKVDELVNEYVCATVAHTMWRTYRAEPAMDTAHVMLRRI